MAEFELIRTFFYQDRTVGELCFNDEYVCDTLEYADHNLERYKHNKFYNRTAIPRGTYSLSYVCSNGNKSSFPVLQNVPDFSDVSLIEDKYGYMGKYGSILVGKIDDYDKIDHYIKFCYYGDYFYKRNNYINKAFLRNGALEKIREIFKTNGSVLKISVM